VAARLHDAEPRPEPAALLAALIDNADAPSWPPP